MFCMGKKKSQNFLYFFVDYFSIFNFNEVITLTKDRFVKSLITEQTPLYTIFNSFG